MRLIVTTMLAFTLAACAARKIPGTEIDDTSDTRGVIDTVNKFRVAVEERNTQSVIKLVDESFRDDGGSSTPEDDLDYKRLFSVLPTRFQRVEDMRLDMSVRKVEFDEGAKNARVTYTYTMSFRMPGLTSRTQTETDIKQMTLKRITGAEWKITSGI